MEDLALPYSVRFMIALGLAFLIGLERESSSMIEKGRVFAGVRTYSLIGVFGFGCGWMFHIGIDWVLPIGLLSICALALFGYQAKLKQGHVGWTSEVAALLTFLVGSMTMLTEIWVPLALGIVGTFLLSEKSKLEKFVQHLDKTEFLAVVKFLIVTLIVLPILPNIEYTQFNLNPRRIWQIVVLVSSIGFAGYFLSKKFGEKLGLRLSGILGGIVTSTAVAISTGRIARKSPNQTGIALQASLLASSVMYLRILVLIWIIRPDFVEYFWLKLTILTVIGIILAFTGTVNGNKARETHVEAPRNPFEIKPALIFAVMFVVLSVVSELVKSIYGDAGLLALAGITGVTDIDPFILSMISHSEKFQILVVNAILISMMSNTIMKGVYFSVISGQARFQTGWRYGLWALLHIPVILIS